MGSSAGKNTKPTTNNISAAAAHSQPNTPRRGGNNFREVEVRQADNHVTEDFRPSSNQQQSSNSSPHHTPENMAQRNGEGGLAASVGKKRTEAVKTVQKARELNEKSPVIGEQSAEDIVFETFVQEGGREYQCIYTGGMRFYLDDWHSKEWQPFPERWYKQGTLTSNTVAKDYMQQQQQRRQGGAGGSSSRGGNSQGGGGSGNAVRNRDDREGTLNHPTRGKITTYLFSEKQYSHCYFDRDSGSWLRLPIGWELHHELIKNMVDQVEEALPNWKDRLDILAALRASNYSPDECISMYLMMEGDEWLKVARTSKDAKQQNEREKKLSEMEAKVKELEEELRKQEKGRKEAEEQLGKLEEKFSSVSAEARIATTQVEAMQSSRPRTARPKTPKVTKAAPAGLGIYSEDMDELNNKAKSLHKSHVHLKMDVERHIGTIGKMLKEALDVASQIKKSESGQMKELEEVRALYQKEALQRKLLYNQLQELRGNIRVFCRARKDDRAKNCLTFVSDQDITITNNDGNKKKFNFDKIFDINTSQEQIFEDTKPIITSCVDGYNVCLMAYGQTGSGKTFTMMGPDSNPGINIRAITELLKVCQDRVETVAYTLKVSLVEIYNETVVDLLTPDAKIVDLKVAGNNIRIPNLTDYPVESVKDIKHVMSMGDKNRSTASTKMNSTSSRSHLVLMLHIEGTDKVTGAVSRGVLTLCDLAGSERIGKTEAEGQRLVEAAAINKSLSALGQVFSALRTSQLHVPYRNSKLTQILKPSLGGDAKACLFVNVSPDVKNYQETCNTLDFGGNARQVALGQAKQNIVKKGH